VPVNSNVSPQKGETVALLSNQWLKPVYSTREEWHRPVEVSFERNTGYYHWQNQHDVFMTFRMSRPDYSYQLLALQAADVDFAFGELARMAGHEIRSKVATQLLSEFDDKELLSVLSEAFRERHAKHAG
jgi:hypothetical protein